VEWMSRCDLQKVPCVRWRVRTSYAISDWVNQQLAEQRRAATSKFASGSRCYVAASAIAGENDARAARCVTRELLRDLEAIGMR
jgi:hypothetical protein